MHINTDTHTHTDADAGTDTFKHNQVYMFIFGVMAFKFPLKVNNEMKNCKIYWNGIIRKINFESSFENNKPGFRPVSLQQHTTIFLVLALPADPPHLF